MLALSAPTALSNTMWYACVQAPGSVSIMPTVMIIETPFPTPLCVICSPSQVRTMQPAVIKTTLTTKKIGIFPATIIEPHCAVSKPEKNVPGL